MLASLYSIPMEELSTWSAARKGDFITFISYTSSISKKDSLEYLRRKISWGTHGRKEKWKKHKLGSLINSVRSLLCEFPHHMPTVQGCDVHRGDKQVYTVREASVRTRFIFHLPPFHWCVPYLSSELESSKWEGSYVGWASPQNTCSWPRAVDLQYARMRKATVQH